MAIYLTSPDDDYDSEPTATAAGIVLGVGLGLLFWVTIFLTWVS